MSRRTVGLVDGNGFYFSRAASGGRWVFLSSVAVDREGLVAPEVQVPAPYTRSPSANVRQQSRYILDQYVTGLKELGTSMENVAQVEQYVQTKDHADGYLETSRGPGFLEYDRPSSALIETGNFWPEEIVVAPTGFGFIPDSELTAKEIRSTGLSYARKYPEFGESYTKEAPFSEVVLAGPYVFCTLWASDYETGVHPDVKLPDWVWWGNEMRNEAVWAIDALRRKLEAGGTTIDNGVHCTVLLGEIEDLFELDLIWQEAFGDSPPARTVIPVSGFGAPRFEGAKHHRDGSPKMEIQFRSIRPGYGATKEIVSTGREWLGHEPEAVKADNLLWISGQFAGDASGLLTSPDAPSQFEFILDRLGEICDAAGTNIRNLLRVRGYVLDVADTPAFYAALRKAVPVDPPSAIVAGVPGPFQVPGCTVLVDAVGYVE
jgi:enamine deaminase RidA (YjgF/YER057c/UK114 family)